MYAYILKALNVPASYLVSIIPGALALHVCNHVSKVGLRVGQDVNILNDDDKVFG